MPRKSLTQHAKSFDEFYRMGGGRSSTVHDRMLFQSSWKLHDHGAHTILDVGCGRGRVVRGLIDEGYDACGTEISSYLFENDLKKVPAHLCDVESMGESFDNDSFDAVIGIQILDHLRDEDEVDTCIREARRIARKGVMFTVGGDSSMKQMDQPLYWWKDRIERMASVTAEIIQDKQSGAAIFVAWFNK